MSYQSMPNPFANALDEVDYMLDDEGKVYVSVHTIDLANAAIYKYVCSELENEKEIPEDFLNGVAWTMITYQQLHDALQTAEVPNSVEDLTNLWEE